MFCSGLLCFSRAVLYIYIWCMYVLYVCTYLQTPTHISIHVCVCVSDGSPSSSPVDHRQVQADLAEVMVNLHPPKILTPTSVQITWTVRACLYSIYLSILIYLNNTVTVYAITTTALFYCRLNVSLTTFRVTGCCTGRQAVPGWFRT